MHLLPAVALALLIPTAALAADSSPLAAGQGRVIALQERTAVVYFTKVQDNLEVVATVAPEGEAAALRIIQSLGPSQSIALEVPGAFGIPADRLILTRDGDSLRINTSEQQTAAR